VIGAAITVGRISVGDIDESRSAAAELGWLAGAVRCRNLTAEQKAEILEGDFVVQVAALRCVPRRTTATATTPPLSWMGIH
jgi:hypothetical protein